MEISREDLDALRNEKYSGALDADMSVDIARLEAGEPLAYVIGTMPFLGLSIGLDSRPLIPRPETEWWTELLINHLNTTIYGCIEVEGRNEGNEEKKEAGMSEKVQVLDMCAGSGAIGLAVLKHCPYAYVSFGELSPEHTKQIQENLEINALDASRADIRQGDLFESFKNETFSIIATNPPYIPNIRTLSESVSAYEPREALFAGADGLELITRILKEAPHYLAEKGELWMECDISNIETASALAIAEGASYTKIRTDQYGRPRLLVAYY